MMAAFAWLNGRESTFTMPQPGTDTLPSGETWTTSIPLGKRISK